MRASIARCHLLTAILMAATGSSLADEGREPHSSYFCEWQQARGLTDCSKDAYDALDTDATFAFNDWRADKQNAELAAKQKEREEERKATWMLGIRAKSIHDLCDEVKGSYGEEATNELKRRGQFTAAQWKRIDEGTIRIGDPESLIRCSWGVPDDVNTTTTAAGRTRQYVYGNSYVYTTNGVVDAIQN